MDPLRLRVLAVVIPLLWPAVPASAQTIIYVDDDAPPGGDGLTWDTAFKYLQDALAAVGTNGTEVRVAQGLYMPDQDEAGQVTPGDRSATFQLLNGVAIYGGYAGLANPNDPDARDVQAYETTLSGDLLSNDVGTSGAQENSYHVVTGSGTDATAILDGITITAGHADGGGSDSEGGGMFTTNGSPSIIHCTFGANWAEYGGGMYTEDGGCVLSHSVFRRNVAGQRGGGMCIRTGSPIVTNCTFTGNSAWSGGGMDSAHALDVAVTNSTFRGNQAHLGGAFG